MTGIRKCEIVDLPGLYSLYPKSLDEQIPFHILCDPNNDLHPDLTVVVADGTNLKRNLFLCSQIVDLKIPAILVINMIDMVEYKGIHIAFDKISGQLGVPVVPMNARKLEGVRELKEAIFSTPVNKVAALQDAP
jgi:ferrous iron transport protein B